MIARALCVPVCPKTTARKIPESKCPYFRGFEVCFAERDLEEPQWTGFCGSLALVWEVWVGLSSLQMPQLSTQLNRCFGSMTHFELKLEMKI